MAAGRNRLLSRAVVSGRRDALVGELQAAEKGAGAAASGYLHQGRRSRWLRGQRLGRFFEALREIRELIARF